MKTLITCSKPITMYFVSAIFLMFLSCSPTLTLADIQKDLGLEYLPDEFDYPESEAVIISESHNVDLDFDTNFEISTYEDVRIVKKIFKNFDEQAAVELEFPYWLKLEKIQGRTLLPDGRAIPLEKSDFHMITGGSSNSVFFSDEKTVKFTFKSVEKNAVVEYDYRVRNDRPFVQDVWWIQDELPKLRNRYTLNVPTILLDHGWNWMFKAYNYNVGEPTTTVPIKGMSATVDRKTTFEWSLKNIPAFHHERMMPPVANHIAHVKFAPSDWKSYGDIAKGYQEGFFQPQMLITEGIRAKALELTAQCKDDRERLQKVYDYVRSLRYVAIELNVGGIKPNFPQTVLDRQYGDCKDKAILLVSMLRSLNIKAYPVLVLTADKGLVDPQFPSWNFNHMIVKSVSDGQDIWMDPTAETHEFGRLPWTDEGISTLVVYDDGTGKIETTPSTKYDQNVTDVAITCQNTSAADVKYSIAIAYTGEAAYDHQYWFKDKTYTDMKKFCQSLIVDDYLGASLDTVFVTKSAAANQPLTLQFSFTAPNAIQRQGDLYLLNLDPYKVIDNWNWLILDSRDYPIDFKHGQLLRKKITVKLQNNLAIRSLPTEVKLINPSMLYTKRYAAEGSDSWTCQESFALQECVIWPDQYKNAKSFFQKMKASVDERIVLTNRTH